MSTLLEQIKKDQLEARKSKSKIQARLLTTLIGAAAPAGTGVVDNKSVLATINSFLKSNRYSQDANQKRSDPESTAVLAELKLEESILEVYQPDKLQGAELESEIVKIATAKGGDVSMRDMGKVLGKLRTLPYTIDMADAKNKFKKLFA